MTTIITATSSAAIVAQDLITDRSIVSKIFLCILYTSQLSVSWVIALLYTFAFIQYNRSIEMVLTWLILAVGNYLITGIANGVIYWRRWTKSALTRRRKTIEENKDAWVMLRLLLSLLGLSPIGRYIETIVTIRKLLALEEQHLHKVVEFERESHNAQASVISGGMSEAGGRSPSTGLLSANKANNNSQNGSRRGNNLTDLKLRSSRAAAAESVVSGTGTDLTEVTRASSISRAGSRRSNYGVDERAYRKVRRARRQMRRCEHDSAQLALFSGFCAAAPMCAAQIFVVLHRDAQRYQEINVVEYVFAYLCIGVSAIWAAAALCHYYPAKRTISEAEFERGIGLQRVGAILLFFARIIAILTRCLALGAFASVFHFWVFLVMAGQWLLGLVVFLVARCIGSGQSGGDGDEQLGMLGDSVSQAMTPIDTSSVLDYILYAYVNIFDFINGNEGLTRCRYLIYYLLAYGINVGLVLAWYFTLVQYEAWYRTPILIVVLCGLGVAFVLLQVYLLAFHTNRGSVSLFGLCQQFGQDRHQLMYAGSQQRESLFGTSVAQSAVPFYKKSPSMHSASNKSSPKGEDRKRNNANSSAAPPLTSVSQYRPPASAAPGDTESIQFDSVSQVGPLNIRKAPAPGQSDNVEYVPQLYPGRFTAAPHPTEVRVDSNTLGNPTRPNMPVVRSAAPAVRPRPTFAEGNSDTDSSSEEDAIFVPKMAVPHKPPSRAAGGGGALRVSTVTQPPSSATPKLGFSVDTVI